VVVDLLGFRTGFHEGGRLIMSVFGGRKHEFGRGRDTGPEIVFELVDDVLSVAENLRQLSFFGSVHYLNKSVIKLFNSDQ